MTKQQKFNWLVSPKSFIQLIGAEYGLLRRSGSGAVGKYYIAAVTIIFILLISTMSIFYAMELLFHKPYMEIILAIFVSTLFTFIYIFLLNTFSKNLFKNAQSGKRKSWTSVINLADGIRIGFVGFIAFLIAKPVEVFLWKKELSQQVVEHRNKMLAEYKGKMEQLNKKEKQQLQRSIAFYTQQQNSRYSTVMQEQIDKLSAKVNQINNKQEETWQQAKDRIGQADFLLFRIREISKKPASWIVSAVMVIIYLIPGALIYSIAATDEYYQLKKEYEAKMILEEYTQFEQLYTGIFAANGQPGLWKYTKFLDPPFNTQQKPQPQMLPQNDFFKKYSSE